MTLRDDIDKEVRRRQAAGEQIMFFHKEGFVDPKEFEEKLRGAHLDPNGTVLKLHYLYKKSWAGEPYEALLMLK
jgi:hypothetical protein